MGYHGSVSVYRVIGTFNFREHKPGETFFATLDHEEERRALLRGNIEIIRRGALTLEEHRIRPPKG